MIIDMSIYICDGPVERRPPRAPPRPRAARPDAEGEIASDPGRGLDRTGPRLGFTVNWEFLNLLKGWVFGAN